MAISAPVPWNAMNAGALAGLILLDKYLRMDVS